MKNNKKVQKNANAAKSKATSTKKAVTPAKSLKSNAKQASKPAAKAPVKTNVKKAPVKTVAKAKPVAKKIIVKAPAKVTAKKAPVKAAIKVMAKPVVKKVPAKLVAKPAPKAVAVKAPIVVKAALNQNTGQNTGKTVSKTAPATTQRAASGMKQNPAKPAMTQAAYAAIVAARPVYRPIQVINKPLPPMQPVRAMAPAPMSEKVEYKKGDYVVYPAHGVGQIEAIESQIISGMDIKLYAIVFEKDRMRLKVPVFKAHASGLRRLSSPNQMQDAMKTLQGRAHIRRVMWSRRAQEYETKINSGDPVAIAEVLRDLKRSNDDNEQSYSERQIYQSALERLAREVAALERITEIEASEKLEVLIRGKKAEKKADEQAVKAIAAPVPAANDDQAQAA